MDHIANRIGKLLKSLRQSTGFSQRELADGICSQSEISHIENGKVIPCIYTLLSISDKLGIHPAYFMERINIPEYNLVQLVKVQLREYVQQKEYIKMNTTIKKYEHNPSFQGIEEKQFILWHKSIFEFYISKNTPLAQHYIEQALAFKQSFCKTQQDIHILNSYAILKCEEKQFSQALILFYEAKKLYEQLEVVTDPKLYSKLLYNLSKTYTQMGDYCTAEKYCDAAIVNCKRENSSYLYGELFYQKAFIKKSQYFFAEAESLFKKARYIFQEYDKENYVHITDQQLQEISALQANNQLK
ncbi:helix-turn-helix domain-containing protein [Paenibacillus sp. SGZ-1009]|uniref:helix-turn-helix domain-containing protein n=1 Tax=Paenibacillus campi TaxID=3106031 RepID=UPI002AFECB37|nr:helix-turn-helix domain-containing protein [Paenibacillus sp. SGZ-1009]